MGCQQHIIVQLLFPARLQSLCPAHFAHPSHKVFTPKRGSHSSVVILISKKQKPAFYASSIICYNQIQLNCPQNKYRFFYLYI